MATFQVMNFGNMQGNQEFRGSQVSPRGWHKISREEELQIGYAI